MHLHVLCVCSDISLDISMLSAMCCDMPGLYHLREREWVCVWVCESVCVRVSVCRHNHCVCVQLSGRGTFVHCTANSRCMRMDAAERRYLVKVFVTAYRQHAVNRLVPSAVTV